MSELTAEQTAQAIKEAESIVAEVAQESAGGILALHGSNLWLLSQGLLNYRDAYIGLKGSTDALLTDAERRLSALQADARDAARYRFLRDFLDPDDYYSKFPRWTVACESGGMGTIYRGEKMDAAIDAALNAREGKS